MVLDRTQAPNISQATDFTYTLTPINDEKLLNGANLYSLQLGVQEVVNFEIYFPAGIIYETKKATAKMCARLLLAGTKNKSALDISKIFEQVGASVRTSNTNDYGIVAISCLSKHLKGLLPLLKEVIEEAQFPQEEIDIAVKQAEQGLQVSLKKCDFVGNRKIDEIILGFDNPYGGYINAGDYTKLSREDIVNFARKQYQLSNAQLFIAGQYTDDLLADIKNTFGAKGENAKVQKVPNFSVAPATSKEHRLINDAESVQGAIRIGKQFVRNTHPDFKPMQFTNALFGGYFGSRLMSNIREDKGYTYGIYSYIQHQKGASTLMIATEAGKDVAEKTIEEVWNEMDRLRNEKVSAQELQLVKNYLLGNVLGSLDGPFQIMRRWRGLILNGFTADRFDDAIHTFKTMDSGQILELANKYYTKESFYNLIVY